jgi:hypothetical protein
MEIGIGTPILEASFEDYGHLLASVVTQDFL